MTSKKHLETLFECDRDLRAAERHLLESEPHDLVRTLVKATDEALALDDRGEAVLRLTRLADLCAQVQGQEMAEALVRILNHDEPAVRVAAGEALRDFAYDRYAEVARAIENAAERHLDGPAMEELPWVLAEIGEPSAVPLIARFLLHSNVEVVAAAIEALAELGDPASLKPLSKLIDDPRVVTLEEGDASYSATLGELAQEACDEIEAHDED